MDDRRQSPYHKEFVRQKLAVEKQMLLDAQAQFKEFCIVHGRMMEQDPNHQFFWEDCDSEDEADYVNGSAIMEQLVDEVHDAQSLHETIEDVMQEARGLAASGRVGDPQTVQQVRFKQGYEDEMLTAAVATGRKR